MSRKLHRRGRFRGGERRRSGADRVGGLRGGTFTLHNNKIVLHGARFADDVRVTGEITFAPATSRVTGHIAITGALPGALRVSATLWDAKHPKASVNGTVGDNRLSIRPEAR